MKNTFAKRARDIHSPQDLHREIDGIVSGLNRLLAKTESPARLGAEIRDDVIKIVSTVPERQELLVLNRTDVRFADNDDRIGDHYYAYIPATKTSINLSTTGVLRQVETALADTLDADSKIALARMEAPAGNAGLESLMQKIKTDPMIALMNALPPLLSEFNSHLAAGNGGCRFGTFADKDGVMVYAMPDAGDPKTVACIVPTHDVEGLPSYSLHGDKIEGNDILFLDGAMGNLREAMFDALDKRGRDALIRSLPSPSGP